MVNWVVMNILLLFRTVKHLRPTQVYHQIKYRLVKAHFVPLSAPQVAVPTLKTEPMEKYQCLKGDVFSFLNLEHVFAGWNFTENGMLWAYNQNYFDWINQEGFAIEEGCEWIDKFIAEVKGGFPMDPYPIALRSINWVKFFCRYPECATKERLDSLYSQVKLLEKRLEYHLLGNHLLEDAYALYIGAVYFQDKRLLKKAKKLLIGQLKEQILPDGTHYEQSPMYHCILLDRLLDAINISQKEEGRGKKLLLVHGSGLMVHGESRSDVRCKREEGRGKKEEVRCKREEVRCKREEGRGLMLEGRSQKLEVRSLMSEVGGVLCGFAVRMLGHLESLIWDDGSIPMLNDSAVGIAPTPNQIFDYARRLGLEWKAIPMNECGYRKLKNERMEAIVDIGNITATYQPGHTHADTFNYELCIDGKPFVVDTGISTYNKTERRQLERSTIAHNCVSPDEKNSSEVWGGFRVGRRASVWEVRSQREEGRGKREEGRGQMLEGRSLREEGRSLREEGRGKKLDGRSQKEEGRSKREEVRGVVEAWHDGFGKPCERKFEMNEGRFIVEDWFDGEAVSYIHLAEGADEKRVSVEGEQKIVVKPWRYSTSYNQFHEGKVLEIHFNGALRYTIQ